MELGDVETVSVNKERLAVRGTRKTRLCVVCRQGGLKEEGLFSKGSETRIKNTEISRNMKEQVARGKGKEQGQEPVLSDTERKAV